MSTAECAVDSSSGARLQVVLFAYLLAVVSPSDSSTGQLDSRSEGGLLQGEGTEGGQRQQGQAQRVRGVPPAAPAVHPVQQRFPPGEGRTGNNLSKSYF